MCVRPCVRPRSRRRATFLQKKIGRATLPEISKRWVEMSKSLSRDLRRRPNVTEPSQAESQSQARPGQAEPIAPSSFTQLPQAPPICISGLRPGLCGRETALCPDSFQVEKITSDECFSENEVRKSDNEGYLRIPKWEPRFE